MPDQAPKIVSGKLSASKRKAPRRPPDSRTGDLKKQKYQVAHEAQHVRQSDNMIEFQALKITEGCNTKHVPQTRPDNAAASDSGNSHAGENTDTNSPSAVSRPTQSCQTGGVSRVGTQPFHVEGLERFTYCANRVAEGPRQQLQPAAPCFTGIAGQDDNEESSSSHKIVCHAECQTDEA